VQRENNGATVGSSVHRPKVMSSAGAWVFYFQAVLRSLITGVVGLNVLVHYRRRQLAARAKVSRLGYRRGCAWHHLTGHGVALPCHPQPRRTRSCSHIHFALT
jgi:hypothetical protein